MKDIPEILHPNPFRGTNKTNISISDAKKLFEILGWTLNEYILSPMGYQHLTRRQPSNTLLREQRRRPAENQLVAATFGNLGILILWAQGIEVLAGRQDLRQQPSVTRRDQPGHILR